MAAFCCIQDCNEVNFNISDEPSFAYRIDPTGTPNPDNYRLSYMSVCRDAGNPTHTAVEVGFLDMDERDRIADSRVDVGAYELDCQDVSSELDQNADGIINYAEFEPFARAWLSHDPNDPAWLADPNLADEDLAEGWYEWKHAWNLDTAGDSAYSIDLADLAVFASDRWLWQACWRIEGMESMGLSSPDMTLSFAMESPREPTEPGYADMPMPEIITLVTAIGEMMETIDLTLIEDPQSTESLLEAKDFLQSILWDIQAARQ